MLVSIENGMLISENCNMFPNILIKHVEVFFYVFYKIIF